MDKTEEFVKQKFKEYYSKTIISVPNINKREFGIGSWGKKIEMRHLSFNSNEELNVYLAKDAPFYISYSSAYYLYPELRPMIKKEWEGADLIFDLDAEKANSLINTKKNLEEVKERTINLIENFLLTDFGFSKKDLNINFSGANGYHIHIRNEIVRNLDRKERREIVEYINGTGLNIDSIIKKTGDGRFLGPTNLDHGYRGRFAKFVMNNLQKYRPIKFKNESYLNNWKNAISLGNWTLIMKSIKKQKLEEDLLNLGIIFSQDVDVNVTIDLARLIRTPNTLHGGSSLCAINIQNLDKFEPMNDAVIFSEKELDHQIEILQNIPELFLKNKTFPKLKKGEIINPQEDYALFLLCKKTAKII